MRTHVLISMLGSFSIFLFGTALTFAQAAEQAEEEKQEKQEEQDNLTLEAALLSKQDRRRKKKELMVSCLFHSFGITNPYTEKAETCEEVSPWYDNRYLRCRSGGTL